MLARKRRNRAGVSYLEVAVTLVIVVILAGAAVVGVGPRIESQRLQSATDSIQLGLQQTQILAMRQNDQWTFALDPVNNRFTYFVTSGNLPANPDWKAIPATRRQAQVVAASTTFPIVNGNYTVIYDDQGAVVATGSFQLINAATQLQTRVFVNQLIGVVEKQCLLSSGATRENCS